MPALLIEDVGVIVYGRCEHCVKVNPCKVHEVRVVSAGNGENSLVGVGHGVEEGVHGALHELQKGLLYGVFLGAAKNRVLQYVEDTRIVRGRSLKGYGKELVLTAVFQPDKPCSCLYVLHLYELRAAVGGGSCSCNGKSVDNVVCFHCLPPVFVYKTLYHYIGIYASAVCCGQHPPCVKAVRKTAYCC